ncbi:MAG: hypothetical protein K9N34_10405, partial [Candidatus Marinimicrobia bacterium]|nr:hypothetical protein [Candidatus Neomarinimicrobiota bacterium]
MWNRNRWTRKLLSPPVISVTTLHFAATMLLITIWRLLWLWLLRESITDGTGALIFRAFGVGLRLDLVVAAGLTLPVFLLSL